MADPHSDDYFARAARRLGAMTETQLAECRHLQHVGRGDKPLSQIAYENAYLDSTELFSVLQEADRIRQQEAGPKPKRRIPWLALSITSSTALLAGFIAGIVLSPQPKGAAAPAPGPASKPTGEAAQSQKGRGRALADVGERLLKEAMSDQYRAMANPHRIDESLHSAAESFSAACALEPDSVQAYLGRGRARQLLGDLDRAEQDFTKALELAPGSEQGWYDRGCVRLERSLEWSGLARDPDVSESSASWRKQAAEDFQKSIDRGLRGVQKLYAEAAIAWHSAGIDAAQSRCAGSEWETSSSEDLHRLRGEVLAAKGEYVASERAFSRAIELRAHFPEAILSRGLVRAKLSQHLEALADFTGCVERRRYLERALYHRGHSHSALGRHNSAIADWRRCLDLGSPRADRLRDLIKEAEAKTKF